MARVGMSGDGCGDGGGKPMMAAVSELGVDQSFYKFYSKFAGANPNQILIKIYQNLGVDRSKLGPTPSYWTDISVFGHILVLILRLLGLTWQDNG